MKIIIVIIISCAAVPLYSQTFTSSNLPIVIINTHGQTIMNEPKITADMGIIYKGEGVRNYVTDSLNHFNGKIGIEIRGSSTQMFPKKQYSVETRDASGNDLSVSLFGMPSEADWILSAEYDDKSLMRDVVAYTLSNSIGRYASRTKYCEVVINGEYLGVYMLYEKIKRDKNRVNISKLDSTGVSGDALTGGYIIKVDKLDGSGNDGWYSGFLPNIGSPFKIYYQYHYPKPEDITSAQKEYIKNFVLSYEIALYYNTFADTGIGYPKYFDVPSMVDFFLMNELTKNVDGFRLSMYMYKDKDSKNPKLFFGPVWDFNAGFGNCDYYDASKIQGWQLTYLTSNASFLSGDNFQVPYWWKKIYQDTSFMNLVKSRWELLRKDQFRIPRINSLIDSFAVHIDEAQQRNFVRWPILNTYVWPNAYIGGTYAKEIIYLKQWILDRVNWMDMQLSGKTLSVPSADDTSPGTFALTQNYPNPFNPATTVKFQIPSDGEVSLSVYDLLGNKVVNIIHGEMTAGLHTVNFNASGLSSGIYFYRLNSGSFSTTKKMILMK